MKAKYFLKFFTGVAMAAVMGCASKVGTIDRTQPNGIDKAQFEGIWYHRAGIIDTDAESGETEGISSNMEKVRFEITEALLIAYRSYEFVPYAEGLTDEGRDFFGAPVGAWIIQKHFDIQREYNKVTGVETNVIVENDTDRPWHERQYIRVDWSKNVVDTPTIFFLGFVNYPDGYFSGRSLGYYTQGHEETDPNRPMFTENYFDVTNTYNVEPDPMYCNYMLLYNGVPRCGTGTVKVRLSFKKVDPNDDYEALYYPDIVELEDDAGNALIVNSDGRLCQTNKDVAGAASGYDPSSCEAVTYPYDAAFGNFRILRSAFDKERYLTRTGRVYLAGRYDIWEDSWNEENKLRPYAERKAKPIVYYGNPEFPEHLIKAAQKNADSWAKPFEEVVAFHQGKLNNDGQPNIQAVQSDLQARGLGNRMFQFRQNTCNPANIQRYVRETDGGKYRDVVERLVGSVERVTRFNVENVCAAVQFAELQDGKTVDPAVAARDGTPMAFTWERLYDLRYSFQNYIEQTQSYGPWGVAQFGIDPETGEYVSGIANYFGDTGDTATQGGVDLIQWLNVDLDDEALFKGDITRSVVASRATGGGTSINDRVRDALMAHEKQLLEQNGETLFARSRPHEEQDRLRRMFGGTDVERELLITDEILRGFAGPTYYQPSGAPAPSGFSRVNASDRLATLVPGQVSEDAMKLASPVNWGLSPEDNTFEKIAYEFGKRAYDLAEFFDPNTAGLADAMKGKPREEIFDFLQAELFAAVQGHEVGHTLGLRHNFQASIDPMNYKEEFWKNNYWAADNQPNPNNIHNGNEYKYASIMDYGFDLALEGLHGIGRYDEAAIRFMYGQLVHVWDPDKVVLPDARKYGSFARRCGQTPGSLDISGYSFYLAPEQLPRLFGAAASPEVAQARKDGMCGRLVDACGVEYSSAYDDPQRQGMCETRVDRAIRDIVADIEARSAQFELDSYCFLTVADLNAAVDAVTNPACSSLSPEACQAEPDCVYESGVGCQIRPVSVDNMVDARKLVTVETMTRQRKDSLTNTPEYNEPATGLDESRNYVPAQSPDECGDSDGDGKIDRVAVADDDGDGIPDDKGYDWSKYLWQVEYAYCSDLYAGFSNPWCQRWDTGWDFKEAVENHINRYDRDYIFSNFRRDAFAVPGRNPFAWYNPSAYMSRLLSRRLYHMSSVFRFYLYTRSSGVNAPVYKDWAEATYRGVNFLERMLSAPEPGSYCLDSAKNQYVPLAPGANCANEADRFDVGIGYGQGRYLDSSWTNEYAYKANRIGAYYDKLAAMYQLTSSSGLFARDFSDLFNRGAFSLGYQRVYLDPMMQRFAALIEGSSVGYEPRVLTSVDEEGKVAKQVRYMPFFDESETYGKCLTQDECSLYPRSNCTSPDGVAPGVCVVPSVRTSLDAMPTIQPAWSYSLSYYALLFSISNWSSISDYAPEMYRFTKIAIKGTPEDVEYGTNTRIEEFTDPETLITYRAPILEPQVDSSPLGGEFPAYYGNRISRIQGKYRNWGIGANLLARAKKFVTEVYTPAKEACVTPDACDRDPAFQAARQQLNEYTGFIDRVRKFNRRAELDYDY